MRHDAIDHQTTDPARRVELDALRRDERHRRIAALLEELVWPQVPGPIRGVTLTRQQEDEILGYGSDGV